MMVGPLLLAAALGLLLSILLGPRNPRTGLGLTLGGMAAALVAALLVLFGAGEWEWRSLYTLGGQAFHLRMDAISAFFIALLCVVGGAGTVYAREYWSDAHYPASAPKGRAWWSGFILTMGMVLVSSNGLHFLIGWELFAVCSYFLITLENKLPAVRAAGWLYLGASHVGTLFLFAFFAALSAQTGSWDLGPMREQAHLAPLFWLALAGFGVKCGLFPLHVWLPSAHANAPSHVSAIMSGFSIKMGIYGIIRFSGWLPVPAQAGWVVIGLGAVSAVIGIAFALAQTDYKRLLAYCSVENIGIILIGIGAALLAITQGNAPWGPLALVGALFHVWNHGICKAMLFLGAGSVLHATETREINRLGGLWRTMPWTATLFSLGAVAMSGLPPLNNFISEWLIYLGLFDAVTTKGAAAWAAIPAAILMATAGALALATFVKVCSMLFLGAPRTKAVEHAHECGLLMRGPMIALASLCVLLGVAPVLVWPALMRTMAVWHPAWNGVDVPAPLTVLSITQGVLALVLITAALWLWKKIQANGLSRGLTWDCGYAEPSARMQYTSSSFADIAAGWFAWILRPVLNLRRPRGLLPAKAFRLEHIPETVLDNWIGPIATGILFVSTNVRRLQHGRLQYYILYVVAGLAALGIVVLTQGMP
ncbi:MAG: proton-conducting transporter membrane subunit [Verrucomicrobiota bacterium]|nr:proton-conducting transporter membrane subunit [Verrucomicrobiota bacterium]